MSISIQGLSFAYGDREVLNDVSFSARPGQLLSVLGTNGVGKSTLFRCILGLLRDYAGTITIAGDDVRNLSPRELAQRIAYIPQSHYLSFNYTVFDMVLMGTTHRLSPTGSPGSTEQAIARHALELFDISHLSNRDFSRISGGEKQLVLMARAIAQQAPVLILDEPTANLDFANQVKILLLMRKLAESGHTVIQSTHNPDQTFLYAHQVIALKDGQVCADGSPGEVLTESLLSALYELPINVQSLFNDTIRVCLPQSAVPLKGD